MDSAESFFDWVDRVISKEEDRVKEIVNMVKRGERLLNCDYLPTRYNLDGQMERDEWPNFQLDGYGTWLWALSQHIEVTGKVELIHKYKRSIKVTIEYLICLWKTPNYDCWEENGDRIHPATLACIFGGLNSISKYLEDIEVINTAANIKQFVLDNCVENGHLVKYIGYDCVDSSLIWVSVPFGMLNPEDEVMKKTILEIESKLVHNYGVHRYLKDTYYGGGEWLLLSGYLGWYYTEIREIRKAQSFLDWIEKQADENGNMTEQVLYHVNDPDYIAKWQNLWGETAKPLLWSHAIYLILKQKIAHKYY